AQNLTEHAGLLLMHLGGDPSKRVRVLILSVLTRSHAGDRLSLLLRLFLQILRERLAILRRHLVECLLRRCLILLGGQMRRDLLVILLRLLLAVARVRLALLEAVAEVLRLLLLLPVAEQVLQEIHRISPRRAGSCAHCRRRHVHELCHVGVSRTVTFSTRAVRSPIAPPWRTRG